MSISRLLAIIGLVIALTTAALAGTADAPVTVVRRVVDEGLAAIAAREASIARDPARARALIVRLLVPHTDTRGMARFVADGYWQQADEAVRERFTAAFRAHLVHSYAAGLSEYAGRIAEFARTGEIHYQRLDEGENRTVVRATLIPDNGRSVAVDLYLHRESGQWLVDDVRAVGVSILIAFRVSLMPRLYIGGLEGVSEHLEQRAHARIRSSPDSPRR